MPRLGQLTSVNADPRKRTHLGRMARPATSASFAYIADRLRAHARLCRQVALECRGERGAGEFARLADHCSRTANELATVISAAESTRYH